MLERMYHLCRVILYHLAALIELKILVHFIRIMKLVDGKVLDGKVLDYKMLNFNGRLIQCYKGFLRVSGGKTLDWSIKTLLKANCRLRLDAHHIHHVAQVAY